MELLPGDGAVVLGVGVVGIEAKGGFEIGEGAVEFADDHVGEAAGVECLGEGGAFAEGCSELGDGFALLALV